MTKAVPQSRSIEVAELIARDVQSGLLAPGMWLKQIDLEQRYRCSRGDVRLALDRLAQKRILQHVPNRGYHVYEQDGRQHEEVREIRVILETAMADVITARADGAAIERLDALARRFDQLVLTGTMLDLYEANLAFHRELLGLAGNRELLELVEDLRRRTSSAPVAQWRTRERIERSGREHHEMIAAIRDRDAERLRRVLTLHIRQPDMDGKVQAAPAAADIVSSSADEIRSGA